MTFPGFTSVPIRAEPSSESRRYAFHGVGISVAGAPPVLAAIDERLRHFRAAARGAPDVAFDFVLAVGATRHSVPVAKGRRVYELPAGQVLYLPEQDLLYLERGDAVWGLCDLAAGRSRFCLRQPEGHDLWLASHLLFTLALIELLKRRGLFSLHAAGVAFERGGLLLAGTSGSGKSTLVAALLREAGTSPRPHYLADDMLFLEPARDGPRVLAFPEAMDVSEETARLVPELAHLPPPAAGWPKRQARPEAVFGVGVVESCAPRALVFPAVVDAERSILEPIEPGAALLELVPNALLTEKRSTQAHLDALGELARRVPCYRLRTGRDLGAASRLLRRLVA